MEEINDKIASSHNPELVIPSAAPNGNLIYHIYNDGEISYQKGGHAYGNRSEFTLLDGINYKYKFNFPLTKNNIGYAITTQYDAESIRILILTYVKSQKI